MSAPTDMSASPVPLLDLGAQYRDMLGDLERMFAEFIRRGQFVLGPYVESFEAKLAAFCGVTHAVGLSNGTDAMVVPLMALEIGPGDEVVTTPFTFFGTAGSIWRVGAKPVFVDIEPGSFNIDPHRIEQAITPRTKAIMPVHLYGQVADMNGIGEVAARHELPVIEDAAQAIGARDAAGRSAGSIGAVGCLSFYPTKNLSAMGEAGACLTNDDELADRLRQLRNHGQSDEYRHERVGGNFRLDALQAAVLELKLARLPVWNARRRELARRYDAALTDTAVTPPPPAAGEHVYHQYTVRVPDGRRDALRRHMARRDIGCRVYYPLPVHLQPCFAALGHRPGDFPASEEAAGQVLSLPIYPELTDAAQQRVIEALRSF